MIWGHEHECLIDPEYSEQQQFHITQPGSSIATALSEGESKTKHVGLLKIRGKEFSLKKMRLKTVRPFVVGDIVLADIDGLSLNSPEELHTALTYEVEKLIERVTNEWREENHDELLKDPSYEMPRPLVRLRVEYTGFSMCNVQRFGQQFVDKLANPKDILLFHRRRTASEKKDGKAEVTIKDEDRMPDQLDIHNVEDLVTEYLEHQNLEIFPEKKLAEAVRNFVEKEEKEAIKDFVQQSLKTTRDVLSKRVRDAVEDEIVREAGVEKLHQSEEFERKLSKLGDDGLPEATMTKASAVKKEEEVDEFDDDDGPAASTSSKPPLPKIKRETSPMVISDDEDRTDYKAQLAKFGIGVDKGKEKEKKPAATTARGRGRGSRATPASYRGKSKDADSFDSDDSEETETATKSKATRGKGAGAKGRGGKAAAAPPARTLESLISMRKTQASVSAGLTHL